MIASYNLGQSFYLGFLELWLNYLCNFFGSVAVTIIHSSLPGIGESLNNVGVGIDVALFCTKSGIGNIARIFSKRCNYVAVAFFL